MPLLTAPLGSQYSLLAPLPSPLKASTLNINALTPSLKTWNKHLPNVCMHFIFICNLLATHTIWYQYALRASPFDSHYWCLFPHLLRPALGLMLLQGPLGPMLSFDCAQIWTPLQHYRDTLWHSILTHHPTVSILTNWQPLSLCLVTPQTCKDALKYTRKRGSHWP